MRETLQQAAKRLLTKDLGSEHTISIDVNDGLTGAPAGGAQRGTRTKDIVVKVEEQTRKDGKKRRAVRAVKKGDVVASGTWA